MSKYKIYLSENEARAALKDVKGDLAEAIMNLKK